MKLNLSFFAHCTLLLFLSAGIHRAADTEITGNLKLSPHTEAGRASEPIYLEISGPAVSGLDPARAWLKYDDGLIGNVSFGIDRPSGEWSWLAQAEEQGEFRLQMRLGAGGSLSLFHPQTLAPAIVLDPLSASISINGSPVLTMQSVSAGIASSGSITGLTGGSSAPGLLLSSGDGGAFIGGPNVDHSITFKRGVDGADNVTDFHESGTFRFFLGGPLESQAQRMWLNANDLGTTARLVVHGQNPALEVARFYSAWNYSRIFHDTTVWNRLAPTDYFMWGETDDTGIYQFRGGRFEVLNHRGATELEGALNIGTDNSRLFSGRSDAAETSFYVDNRHPGATGRVAIQAYGSSWWNEAGGNIHLMAYGEGHPQTPGAGVLYFDSGVENSKLVLTTWRRDIGFSVAANWVEPSNLIIKAGTGNVGINSLNPTARLQVGGDAKFDGVVRVQPGGDIPMFGQP